MYWEYLVSREGRSAIIPQEVRDQVANVGSFYTNNAHGQTRDLFSSGSSHIVPTVTLPEPDAIRHTAVIMSSVLINLFFLTQVTIS